MPQRGCFVFVTCENRWSVLSKLCTDSGDAVHILEVVVT